MILIWFFGHGAVAQLARALAWHARGQGFKSPQLHHSPLRQAPAVAKALAGRQGRLNSPQPMYTVRMNVTILLGSKSDQPHAEKIAAVLNEFDVPSKILVASAHKVPEKVMEIVAKLNADPQPQVVITVVGMSNGLAGSVAGSCFHPVINSPPHKNEHEYLADIHSSLRMPSYVPVMTILNPKNAALAAVKILAESDADLKEKLKRKIKEIKEQY